MKQGIEFVPARMKQKRPKGIEEDFRHGNTSKHANGLWEPTSSEGDHSDSEDSMSDLYPPSMFTVKNIAEEEMGGGLEEEDDFKTDEEEEMELDKPVPPKRKKTQNSGFQKKFRNNNWKASRSKKQKKVPKLRTSVQ